MVGADVGFRKSRRPPRLTSNTASPREGSIHGEFRNMGACRKPIAGTRSTPQNATEPTLDRQYEVIRNDNHPT